MGKSDKPLIGAQLKKLHNDLRILSNSMEKNSKKSIRSDKTQINALYRLTIEIVRLDKLYAKQLDKKWFMTKICFFEVALPFYLFYSFLLV